MDFDSDSDDNIFGNAAAKLAKLKSLYTEDKIESVDLFQDNTTDVKEAKGTNETVTPINPPVPAEKPKRPRKTKKKEEEKVEFTFESLDDFDSELPAVVPQPPNTTTTEAPTGRSKRAKANKAPTLRDLPAIRVIPKQKKKGPVRRGNRDIHMWYNRSFPNRSTCPWDDDDMLPLGAPIASTSSLLLPPQYHHQNDSPSGGPILIGERDYQDNSHNVKIFDKAPKATNDVADVIEDEEELSVKVYWQSWEIYKFTIRTHQQIKQIFEHFAKKENVEMNKLLFMYNDKILSPTDTPSSFNYNIAKVIDGGIVNEAVTYENKNKQKKPTDIKVKFQTQNSKKAFEVSIDKNELLCSAMILFSESIDKPMKQLKFYFDGDIIQGNQTLKQLDFEGGECIDVKFV